MQYKCFMCHQLYFWISLPESDQYATLLPPWLFMLYSPDNSVIKFFSVCGLDPLLALKLFTDCWIDWLTETRRHYNHSDLGDASAAALWQ